MWKPILDYVILRHGATAFDCRYSMPNSYRTAVLTMNEHNKLLLSVRFVLHVIHDWRFMGYAFYPFQTPYYEYQLFLWEFVDNKIEQYKGYKSYNYFHFDVGENRGIAVKLKLGGYLKRHRKYPRPRFETDIIICEPQGQPTYSIVTLYEHKD
ncbi:hypothetical protein Trydic_g5109 [Trypoxylus dichotomus]